ncbi:hypothetical protein [Nostoc sp.]
MKKLSAVGSASALVMMRWMWAMSTTGYSASHSEKLCQISDVWGQEA